MSIKDGLTDMRSTLVIVGQAPAIAPGRTSARVKELFGIEEEELKQRAEWINLIDEYPGKDGKGDAFDLALAAEKAATLDFTNKRAIFLGQNVAMAFGLTSKIDYMRWYDMHGGRIAMIPHPSPINFYYNDVHAKMKVSQFCKTVLAIWGSKGDDHDGAEGRDTGEDQANSPT